MRTRIQTTIVFLMLFAGACVEPYVQPNIKSDALGVLVVDGFLDGVKKDAKIKLSRSTMLNDYRTSPPELGANVSVQLEDGTSVTLKEGNGNGLYTADNLTLDPTSKYRLHIDTQYGTSYTSDPIIIRQSPELDSLVYRFEPGGVRFYINGHDDSDVTKYYQYRWTETWSYRSPFVSHYKSVGGYPVLRKKNELVADCWDSRRSTNVLVASTVGLSKNVISMFPVNFVEKGSRKFIQTYSLLVEQRAVSEEEFDFWQLIEKTNDQLGGLFDPIPARVTGNVHNDADPNDAVLGYFSGGFTKEKRIFFNYEELPEYLRDLDQLAFKCSISDFVIGGGGVQPIGSNVYVEIHIPPNVFYITSANCGDCRNLGGDTIRPKYWPN